MASCGVFGVDGVLPLPVKALSSFSMPLLTAFRGGLSFPSCGVFGVDGVLPLPVKVLSSFSMLLLQLSEEVYPFLTSLEALPL